MSSLNFAHSVPVEDLSVLPVILPLLHHYRQGLSFAHLQPGTNLEIEITCLDETASILESAIPEGKPMAQLQLVHLSQHLQKTLRVWLQLAWFARPENSINTVRSRGIIPYLACRVYQDRQSKSFGHERVEEWSAATYARNLGEVMASTLSILHDMHRIAGREELADFYAPSQAAWFIKQTERHERQFFELLRRESRLLKLWLTALGRTLTPTQLKNLRQESATCFTDLFRRGESFPQFATLFEIEVLAALDLFAGKQPARQFRFRACSLTAPPTPASSGKIIPFPSVNELPRAA